MTTSDDVRGMALPLDSEQPRDVDYRRQAEYAQALNEVMRATSAARDVASASEAAALVLLRTVPGIDILNVWMLNDDGTALCRVVTDSALGDDPGRLDRLPLGEEAGAVRALHEGRVIVWDGDRSMWPGWLRAFAERLALATVAHVPMHSGGRVGGVFSLGSRAARAYAPEELTFLTTLAGQLGGQLDAVRGHERVEAERQRLTSLITTLPEGLLMIEPDGRISLSNQAAGEILGHRLEGASLAKRAPGAWLYTPDGRPFPTEQIPAARALRGETANAVEMQVRRGDDRIVPLLVSAGPVRAADGSIAGAIIVFQDISPLKELDRLKDDFINTVSHELRTPTTTIRGGALTLLKRGDRLDEETRRQLLQDIAEESERLHHLVEDLLTLTRTQAGSRMAPEPLRLHHLVDKVIADLRARMGGREVTVSLPTDLPVVEADPLALEQVLRNLILNAAKYSPSDDSIELTAAQRGDEVEIGVLDRGSGLTPADLSRVFEPFYRTPTAVDSGAQGAGLGLAVCRRLVEMHGGRIWAENRAGGGANFRFTLPVAPDTED